MESQSVNHNTVLNIKEAFVNTDRNKKDEPKLEPYRSYTETFESNLIIKSEEVDIKSEDDDCASRISIKEEDLGAKIEANMDVLDHLKQEEMSNASNLWGTNEYVTVYQNSEVKGTSVKFSDDGIKTDISTNVDESDSESINVAGYMKMDEPNLERFPVVLPLLNLEGEETSVYQNTLENITSKYPSNQGKQKPTTKKKTGKRLLTCEHCSYESTHRRRILSHMVVHKDPSEVTMYQCPQCDFKTKYQRSLKGHSILHKDSAEIPSFKCNFCEFQSKRRNGLNKHLTIHRKISGLYKDPSEFTMHECTQCDFKTKYKHYLKVHSLRHMDTAQLPRAEDNALLKCKQCHYKCMHPSRFELHMRIHADPSELTMYKCTECYFKTKYKQSLKHHYVLHSDPAEMPRFKCNSCKFICKRKNGLKRHMLMHRHPSQTDMHKGSVIIKQNTNRT